MTVCVMIESICKKIVFCVAFRVLFLLYHDVKVNDRKRSCSHEKICNDRSGNVRCAQAASNRRIMPEPGADPDRRLDCRKEFGEKMNTHKKYNLSVALIITGICYAEEIRNAPADASNTALLFAKMKREPQPVLSPMNGTGTTPKNPVTDPSRICSRRSARCEIGSKGC